MKERHLLFVVEQLGSPTRIGHDPTTGRSSIELGK